MNIYEFLPIRLLVEAAYEVVTTLTSFLDPLAGAHSAALAVIVLTVLVRTLLIPVGVSQVRAGITRKRLAPKIAELQTKHKQQPEVMQQKLMELYKEENTSPFAGCLPVLAQMPVLMAVYGLFINSTIGGHANELLGHTLFGLRLDTSFVRLLGAGDLTATATTVYLVLVVLIAVVAGFSRHLLTPAAPETPAAPAPARNGSDAPAMPDLSGVMKTLSFMPFLTAVFALFVPLAAAVYLATTTTWTLAERLVLNRVLGANDPQPDESTRVTD
ncbi:YidC/Oxa1 family membrane protein insertase [Brevibacterium renqingii]|uniref:YidC/Oxa1 family membrane protein insertase n=1 Tax=Brevibacterium renqingii TaxID=2776916 RepID=UPI001ADECAB0|nr:YidC/Oxa1 family membrane protein insertase [Brevibacterium renqingii]